MNGGGVGGMKEKGRRSRSLCGATSAVGAVQPQLAVPEMHGSLFASPHFDRGAFSHSLYPPPAAVVLKARTKRAGTALE